MVVVDMEKKASKAKEEVQEVVKAAERILAQSVIQKNDLQAIHESVDAALGRFGIFPRYFRRLL